MAKFEFSKETKDAIFKQRLKTFLGPKAFFLARKYLRRKSFYPPRFHELQTIFIHIPKSAGTSLGEALFHTGRTGHFEWSLYRAEDRDAFENYFKFCFVREPVSRFLSAYNYLVDGGKDPYDAAMGRDVAKYGDVNAFILSGLRDDGWSKLRHFRPQVSFLCDDKMNVMVDFIGRMERFDADCETIGKKLGVDLKPAKSNRTKRKVVAKSDLSKEALDTLVQIYRDDFAAFNYPVPERE